MRKVSSSPFYLRNIFPMLWFVGWLYLSVLALGNDLSNDVIYFFMALAVFGAIISRMLALRLMDEVYDEGSSLIVRRNSKEQRIYLNQIKQVNAINALISLKTTSEGDIGRNISFIPTSRLFAFKEHSYFFELNERVKRAKNT